MRPIHRWAVVSVGALLLVGLPIAVRALPAHDRAVSAADLLAEVRAGAHAAYSGSVVTQGNLNLPVSHHFDDTVSLLGDNARLRVWWRSERDWRVDHLLDTGEIDLFHHGRTTTRWDYERNEARTSTDPPIRLPRDADLLPPVLARRVLTDVGPDDVRRLPAKRVAGLDALGLRVTPSDPRTSIDHVDLWADGETGVVLRLDVYGTGSQPALSTAFTAVSTAQPTAALTTFTPSPGINQGYDDVLDIADAANQYAPLVPPRSVAGLDRADASRGAVGIFGTGLTQVMTLPLRQQDAADLGDQLKASGATKLADGWLLRIGPLGLVLTDGHRIFESHWLVTGTVDDATLVAAAQDLVTHTRYRG